MTTPDQVVVHPLVLLSVVDHYNRVAKDTRKRVIGLLLGETSKGRTDVTNSFAVPFEEDDRDPSIWFLDHSYLENMFDMYKRVNAREKVVGWYHTGARLRQSDLDITDLMASYCETPLLVICEVQPKDQGLPTTAYYAKTEVREDGTQKSQKVFVNVPTEVGATEAEEIGVEHLLRDVKDSTISTLATEVGRMVTGLKGLKARLLEVEQYLQLVLAGKLPVNHDIMYQLQDVFNLLPNLRMEELSRAFSVKTNDSMLIIYVSALIRSVLALHGLIENKEQRAEAQQAAETAALDADDKAKSGSPAQKDGGADAADDNPSGEKLNEEAAEGHPPGAGGGAAG